MKKALIVIGVVGLIGLGVGYYIYKTQNSVTEDDFNAVINLSKNKGMDIFEDVSPREMAIMKKNYLKSFDIKSHNDFISLLGKGEKNWNASQKAQANKYINTVLKGLTTV
jgi:hypothetical protein